MYNSSSSPPRSCGCSGRGRKRADAGRRQEGSEGGGCSRAEGNEEGDAGQGSGGGPKDGAGSSAEGDKESDAGRRPEGNGAGDPCRGFASRPVGRDMGNIL